MISKKMRKASRFYNTVLKHEHTVLNQANNQRIFRHKIYKLAGERRDRAKMMRGNAQPIPPISYMKRREAEPPKTSILGFIPKSARVVWNILKRVA